MLGDYAFGIRTAKKTNFGSLSRVTPKRELAGARTANRRKFFYRRKCENMRGNGVFLFPS
jgi:hypothetical protein